MRRWRRAVGNLSCWSVSTQAWQVHILYVINGAEVKVPTAATGGSNLIPGYLGSDCQGRRSCVYKLCLSCRRQCLHTVGSDAMTSLMTRLRLAIRPSTRLCLATAGPASSPPPSSPSPAVAIRTWPRTKGAPTSARACSSRPYPVAVSAPTPLSPTRGMASLAAQPLPPPPQNTPFTRAVVQALRSLYILPTPTST